MKLETLLKQITPLPWKHEGGKLVGKNLEDVIVSSRLGIGLGPSTQWPGADANADYMFHAVSVLPDCVAMLRQFQVLAHCDGRIKNDSILADALRKVLNKAENVV